MKIKITTLIGSICLIGSVYAGYVFFDNKVRDLSFENQIEPSFYQKQIIMDGMKNETMNLPDGRFLYTYQYQSGSLVKTLWTFDAGKVFIEGYLVSHNDFPIEGRVPQYVATASAEFQGSVLKFSNLQGDIGLFPKYGLAVKSISEREIVLDTSDGSHVTMNKYGI